MGRHGRATDLRCWSKCKLAYNFEDPIEQAKRKWRKSTFQSKGTAYAKAGGKGEHVAVLELKTIESHLKKAVIGEKVKEGALSGQALEAALRSLDYFMSTQGYHCKVLSRALVWSDLMDAALLERPSLRSVLSQVL